MVNTVNMFLKRLELVGFKSFPEKIKLDFPAGITAVVGPNGSGKSNIADAVRWVMGEQSAKSLRGVKMEDLIFAGTEHRRPLAYAEVLMVLDNSLGLLPVAFTEVGITRRVYRSGESEYLINGSPCRMRDVRSLFMDTGAGREGYSIIGQGRVDEILSSRSEDRRYLFEEAAGIVKYKTRRSEAFSKLEAERLSLERVDDLIAELESQIGPLAEQAEQAKVYLALRERYKAIHVKLFLEEAAAAEVQTAQIKSQINDLSQQSSGAERLLAEAQAGLAGLREQEETAESDYKALNRSIITLATDIEKAEGNKRLAERVAKEIKQRSAARADYIKEAAEFEESLSTARAAMEEKEASHRTYEKQLEELHAAHSRHKLLTEMERSREGYYASVKAVLQHKDRNPSFGEGIFGTVSELLAVPDTYEYAISTALGGSAQNIITATEAEAQRAIDFLKSSKAGRATFLPITAMKPRSQSSYKLLQERGMVGLASSLVSFDPAYAPVFEHLLGNVYVIENLPRAIELSRKHRQSLRLVTLEGDLLSPGGAITGGSRARQSGTDLLGRSRQISQLAEQIAKLSNSRTERDRSNAELTEHKVYISRLSQGQKSAQESKSRLERELSELEAELSTFSTPASEKGDSSSLRAQLEQENSRLAATEDTISKIKLNISKTDATQQELMETIAQLSREATRLEARHEQIEAESRRLHDEVWEAYQLTYQSAKAAQDEFTETISPSQLRREEKRLKAELSTFGAVNTGAIEAHQALQERCNFLTSQRKDILEAESQLLALSDQLTEQMEQQFSQQFAIIAKHFEDVFREMFGGGKASLSMSDPTNILESGIEITAQPPGKRLQSLSLLSGGEKALTAIALLFAILRMKPSPFCILDEIESALDDANVSRFANYMKNYTGQTQFIVITHRKGTMECADTLYGITMQELGVSKMVSVDFR